MGRTHQEAAPSPPVALGPASCPLPGDPALSPLLTWAGRGPRHGAGCKGWWPGPPQTGARRASGTAGPPVHLHTDLGVPSRSPEAEGKPQSVHACTLHPAVRGSNHPFTWHCMSQSVTQTLCPSAVSHQRTVWNVDGHPMCSPIC